MTLDKLVNIINNDPDISVAYNSFPTFKNIMDSIIKQVDENQYDEYNTDKLIIYNLFNAILTVDHQAYSLRDMLKKNNIDKCNDKINKKLNDNSP